MSAERGACRSITPLPLEAAASLLATPWLPDESAAQIALVHDAAGLGVAVGLSAPAGGRRLLLARALHAVAGRRGPLIATTGDVPPPGDVPADGTLFVDVGALTPASLLALEALLDDGVPWVIATWSPADVLPPALATRLDAVSIAVPPLVERRAHLPALAAAVLGRLGARRTAAVPALSDAALECLAAHAWPGDLAELDAVLSRAVLLAGTALEIAPEHLVLAAPAPAAHPPVPPASHPPAADGTAALELLLAEMAHELKNPLVTVKTFAEHLPDMLDDPALRERFAQLAGDAIARMDALLENVLAYARLGAPQSAPVAVGPLLERVVAEAEPALAGRHVTVRQGLGDGYCAADPEHVAYALRNLLEGIVREVSPRGEVQVEASANGVVRVGFVTGNGTGARLRRLASPDGAPDVVDPTLLPLPFTLARAALARAGGSLSVVPEAAGRTAVVVRLPAADDRPEHTSDDTPDAAPER